LSIWFVFIYQNYVTEIKMVFALRNLLRGATAVAGNMSRQIVMPSQRCLSIAPKLLAAKVTEPAPDFKLKAVVDGQFKDLQLSDFSGKYLVIFFYPLDFTFVCPTEIIAFSDRAKEFRSIGAELVAVSTDSHFSHLAWINTPRKQGGLGGSNIPMLADFNKQMSRDYGVLLDAPGLALRGLFIIDPKGIVRQITVNDLPVGRSVDETLRLLKALQFVEKHGEVCPAGWQPNSPTINPAKANEYFEKVN